MRPSLAARAPQAAPRRRRRAAGRCPQPPRAARPRARGGRRLPPSRPWGRRPPRRSPQPRAPPCGRPPRGAISGEARAAAELPQGCAPRGRNPQLRAAGRRRRQLRRGESGRKAGPAPAAHRANRGTRRGRHRVGMAQLRARAPRCPGAPALRQPGPAGPPAGTSPLGPPPVPRPSRAPVALGPLAPSPCWPPQHQAARQPQGRCRCP
mmetsp:Transcript_120277/g.376203  ORF Transcript_120277/g.376203 Transcript_120277/m.376203 type:complete len:208 (+) Transcript_120277:191-814(+)